LRDRKEGGGELGIAVFEGSTSSLTATCDGISVFPGNTDSLVVANQAAKPASGDSPFRSVASSL
jgi:hypothetical protein